MTKLIINGSEVPYSYDPTTDTVNAVFEYRVAYMLKDGKFHKATKMKIGWIVKSEGNGVEELPENGIVVSND